MSKQLQELRTFNAGTILSPDTTDIPLEAASYSLDIDSVTEDGKLKGVPLDHLVGLTWPSGAIEGILPVPISYLLIDGEERLVAKGTSSNWTVLDNTI